MQIAFRVAGVPAVLRCNQPAFIDYCRRHFGDDVLETPPPAPGIMSELDWQVAPEPPEPLARCADWTRLSRGFRAHGDRVAWWTQKRFPDFEVEIEWAGERIVTAGRYATRIPPRGTMRECRDLTYFLFYYPALALRAAEGLLPLHAAAVANGERGVLLVGPCGCGKSTAALLLASRPGWKLVSENLTLVGAGRAHTCREPVVLKHADLAPLLGGRSIAHAPDGGDFAPEFRQESSDRARAVSVARARRGAAPAKRGRAGAAVALFAVRQRVGDERVAPLCRGAVTSLCVPAARGRRRTALSCRRSGLYLSHRSFRTSNLDPRPSCGPGERGNVGDVRAGVARAGVAHDDGSRRGAPGAALGASRRHGFMKS